MQARQLCRTSWQELMPHPQHPGKTAWLVLMVRLGHQVPREIQVPGDHLEIEDKRVPLERMAPLLLLLVHLVCPVHRGLLVIVVHLVSRVLRVPAVQQASTERMVQMALLASKGPRVNKDQLAMSVPKETQAHTVPREPREMPGTREPLDNLATVELLDLRV